jgi:hypothetical protein
MRVAPTVMERTGNFWIDLGVVALWRVVRSVIGKAPRVSRDEQSLTLAANELELLLCATRLEIRGNSSDQYLDRAVKFLRTEQWQRRWWTIVANFLWQGQNNPDEFLLPFSQLGQAGKWKAGGCSFCGLQSQPTRTCGASYFPFLVAVDKMGSFYSGLAEPIRICRMCAFVAPFAVQECWFSGSGTSINLIIPEALDLLKLDRFLERTAAARVKTTPFKNYGSVLPYCAYPSETWLDFCCSLWELIQRPPISGTWQTLSLEGSRFHLLALDKDGNVVTVRRYRIIPDPSETFGLLERCESGEKKRFNALRDSLRSMLVPVNGKPSSRYRDEVASRITEKTDVSEIVEDFLYELVGKNDIGAIRCGSMRKFLSVFMEEVLGMEEETVRALESTGRTLGQLVLESEDRGILFSLRNARSPEDLLDFFHRTLGRYAEQLAEKNLYRDAMRTLCERTDSHNWRRLRSMLGIYTLLEVIGEMQKTRPRPAKNGQ